MTTHEHEQGAAPEAVEMLPSVHLRDYLAIVYRHRWIAIFFLLAALVAGGVIVWSSCFG